MLHRHLAHAAFLLCTLAVSVCRADQAAIRATLDQIQQAVLAGDIPGYLAHIATDDAVFLKEQQNWAADLKLHKPLEFTLAIVEPDPPEPQESGDGKDNKDAKDAPPPKPAFQNEFTTDHARFIMKMSWRMGEDVGGPGLKLREVKYPVEFIGKHGQWLFKGEIWDRVDRPADPATGFEGVRVSYAPGLQEAAEAVAEVMPVIRRRVDALFDLKVARVQEVKLYTSMLHLQASIYLSYKDGLSGWNEPHESVKILQHGAPRKDALKGLLGHEYGHVATFEVMPDSDKVPWWLLEGLADFSAGHVRSAELKADPDQPAPAATPTGGSSKAADSRVIAWHKAGKLADWNDITDFRKTPGDLMGHVYKQGEHFVRYFTTRFGDAGRNRWIRLLGQGQSLDDASKAVTNKTFGELDKDWRESAKKLAEEAEKAEKEKKDKDEPRG